MVGNRWSKFDGYFFNRNNPISINNSDSQGVDLEMSKNNKQVNEKLKSFIELTNHEFTIIIKMK